jgi:hypothetical protein
MKKARPGTAAIAIKRQMAAIKRKKVARAMARLPKPKMFLSFDPGELDAWAGDDTCNCDDCRARREEEASRRAEREDALLPALPRSPAHELS